jgi:diketogulonate reductase-like aldo/keto reductase
VLEIPTAGVEPVVSVIHTLLEEGGRVVDTSVRTEEIDAPFGRVLQSPEIGDEIFLCTKINTLDADTGIAQMRQTQRLFGRRTMDLVQIESLRGLEHHWPRLRGWKESGEARYIGVTVAENENHAPLEAFMRRESPDFVHANYSLMEPNAEERILPLAQDRGFAVLVNRPFMNGSYFRRTAGRPLPEWAADFDCETWAQFSIKYILANPAVTVVLTETTDPEHMTENVAAGLGRLPDGATRRRMREVAATI